MNYSPVIASVFYGRAPMPIFTSAPLLGIDLCQIILNVRIAELDDNTVIDDLVGDAWSRCPGRGI